MSKNEKERRCKACGKLLIDEKIPLCRRCVRNKAGQVGGIVLGLTTIFGVPALKNKKFRWWK